MKFLQNQKYSITWIVPDYGPGAFRNVKVYKPRIEWFIEEYEYSIAQNSYKIQNRVDFFSIFVFL